MNFELNSKNKCEFKFPVDNINEETTNYIENNEISKNRNEEI